MRAGILVLRCVPSFSFLYESISPQIGIPRLRCPHCGLAETYVGYFVTVYILSCMQLWDIGGQPRFRSMWERYCRGVTAIV